ncbi:hypothetical protein [Caulobacter sp. LARHSG274]
MSLPVVQFAAILLTALALVPSGAHALALRNKIKMPQERYFAAQQIYRGWALTGIAPAAAVVVDLCLAYLVRDRPVAAWFSLTGGLCLAATLLIFFVRIWPANQATDDWVSTPPEWPDLRRRWEYGHAVSAGLILVGLCLVTAGALVD